MLFSINWHNSRVENCCSGPWLHQLHRDYRLSNSSSCFGGRFDVKESEHYGGLEYQPQYPLRAQNWMSMAGEDLRVKN